MMDTANVTGNIQSIIDDNKENLTSDVYMKISNALMSVHRQQTTTRSFYEASVIVPKFIPANGSVVHLETSLQKHVVRLDDTVANTYIKDIVDHGYVHMCNHSLPSVDIHYQIYDTNPDRFVDEDDEDLTNPGTELQSIHCDMHAITCIKLEMLSN
tara:strand:- start:991 stop:1458 length:468 start_codon:yes stop_codon:yes gene_type:complete